MPKLPWESDGKVGHVIVTVPGLLTLKGEADVLPRYDVSYRARFSGRNGSTGMDGVNGTDGSSGLVGSIDSQHPSAGGNGGDGTDGTDGGRGEDGDYGPAVLVEVALWPGNRPLLEATVSSEGSPQEWYLIDPNGGWLQVSSDGGSGGKGGRGGTGGRGGSGGIGTPNGSSGRDGLAGHDGTNGFDGRDGQITLVYDPKAAPYISAIRLLTRSPKPIVKERPVPPLW
jgi:hypothetical protein